MQPPFLKQAQRVLQALRAPLAVLLLSACGGAHDPESATIATQIHSGNLLDVYAIGDNELRQSREIEQLWDRIVQQMPAVAAHAGRHSCPQGGWLLQQHQAQERVLEFQHCNTGVWRLDGGRLSLKQQGLGTQGWSMQVRQLRIRSSQGSEPASEINADIEQRVQAGEQLLSRQGRYSVAYKRRVDSVSLSSSYQLVGGRPVLQSTSLTLFPPRFSQQLSITQAASEPGKLVIKSVGDSSTVIGTALAQGLALTWLSGDGNRHVETASLAALDAAYRRVD